MPKLPLLLDSGCQANLIDSTVLENLPFKPKPVDVELKSATHHQLNCQGLVFIPVQLGNLTVTLPFLSITNLPYKAMLSTHFLQRMGAVLDYSRNVLDFWKAGRYSGPIKMVFDSTAKGLDVTLVGVFLCEVGKGKKSKESVSYDCKRNVSDLFCVGISHYQKRCHIHVQSEFQLNPGDSITFELPISFDSNNAVNKFFYNSNCHENVYINTKVVNSTHCILINNKSADVVNLDPGMWIATIHFPLSFSISSTSNSISENSNETVKPVKQDHNCSSHPSIQSYKYSTYPQAIKDGFSHSEIGLIKTALREKEFTLDDFVFSKELTQSEIDEAKTVLCKYKSVFTKNNQYLHTTDMAEADFDMVDDTPVYTPPYRTSGEKLRTMRTQIQDQINSGQIEAATSPYNSGVLLVDKKVDSSYRPSDGKRAQAPKLLLYRRAKKLIF